MSETAGDPGLFGPDSITWRVQSDPVMWVAGLRALFLQATHPAAMAGVLDHSDFRADPWGRLAARVNDLRIRLTGRPRLVTSDKMAEGLAGSWTCSSTPSSAEMRSKTSWLE